MSYNISAYTISSDAVQMSLYMSYIFGATDGNVIVDLKDSSNNILRKVSIYIPPEVYSTWTTDDSIITNYVANQLGVTLS